jgi:hypothetical protein
MIDGMVKVGPMQLYCTDATPLYFFLCRYMKDKVYVPLVPVTLED